MSKTLVSTAFVSVIPLMVAMGSGSCGPADCIEGPSVWTDPPGQAYEVCGDLVVTGRSELDVLRRMTAVGGSLIVQANPQLTQIPELPNLKQIGGSLSISNNERLARIDGFPALAEIPGGVYVGENPALTTFTLGAQLSSVDSLFLALNPLLRDFRCQLVDVADDLTIGENASLQTLEMPALTEVAGNLHISRNRALRALAFPELRRVHGAWKLMGNDDLETLNGFPALIEAATAEFSQNSKLRELQLSGAFTGCKWLFVIDNPSLERVTASPAVKLSATTAIYLHSNTALTLVEGFSGVVSVDRLSVLGNPALAAITGFDALKQVSRFDIIDNDALTGPNGWFPQLAFADDIQIYDNESLPASHVDQLVGHLTVEGQTRIGHNMGQDTPLDPCPWPQDGICDATGKYDSGTKLCLSDPEDCGF